MTYHFLRTECRNKFQLTRSRGAWLHGRTYQTPLMNISTHTLTWSVTDWMYTFQRLAVFQLTRSRGAWQIIPWQKKEQTHFNSHAHVERDYAKVGDHLACQNFNSHAHVERDSMTAATQLLLLNFNSHAHVERDFSTLALYYAKVDFNSHAHVERDWIILQAITSLSISTHTLTWSVTLTILSRIAS